MTKQEWLSNAKQNEDKLISLIQEWHPINTAPDYDKKRLDMKLAITASMAEMACENVRQDIRKNTEGNPVKEFKEALESGDVSKINKLLNDVWFGVPESTSCWSIRGFREAVALIEDLPNGPEESIV